MTDSISTIINDETQFNEFSKKLFDSVDTDKSGEIDITELETLMNSIAKEMGCDSLSKEDIQQGFDELDTDKSGSISFEEFKSLAKDLIDSMLLKL